jgi:hypothetical protein
LPQVLIAVTRARLSISPRRGRYQAAMGRYQAAWVVGPVMYFQVDDDLIGGQQALHPLVRDITVAGKHPGHIECITSMHSNAPLACLHVAASLDPSH